MRDRKRSSLWGTLGIAGLLVVTSACDNKPSPPSSSTPGSKNSGGGFSVGDSGSNTQSLGSGPQNDKQVITTCSDLSQEDCEKTLFGLQRCKKDGDKCVDDPSAKAPESCGDLEEDQCKQSPVCKLNGSDCEDDATWVVAPCNGKNESDCAADATCLVSPYLKTCHKNDKKGRCEFKVELCDSAAACANSYNDGSNDLCEDVTVSDGEECKMHGDLCHFILGKSTAAPTTIKLKTTEANSGGRKVAAVYDGISSKDDVVKSAVLCKTAAANLVAEDETPAVDNNQYATVCQALYKQEMADRIQMNVDGLQGAPYSLSPKDVCHSLIVEGAGSNDGRTANDVRKAGARSMTIDGAYIDADEDNYEFVNLPGWCQLHPKTKQECRVNTANLKNSALCKKYTKAECEAVTAIAGNVPCRWVD